MKIIRRIALCFSFLLASCDDEVQMADSTDWPKETFDGIAFAVPPTHKTVAHESKVELKERIPTRQAHRITISPEMPATNYDPMAGSTVKAVTVVRKGNTPARYWVSIEEGGMGGPEYELHIWKTVGGRTVQYWAQAQREDGVPDFAVAWAVWNSIEMAN